MRILSFDPGDFNTDSAWKLLDDDTGETANGTITTATGPLDELLRRFAPTVVLCEACTMAALLHDVTQAALAGCQFHAARWVVAGGPPWCYGSHCLPIFYDMVDNMKTTIDIADEVLVRARALARARSTTLRALVDVGLRRVLEDPEPTPRPVWQAVVKGGGFAHGAAAETWRQTWDEAQDEQLRSASGR